MAYKDTIGGYGELFIGEDRTLELELLDNPDAETPVAVDMTGWTIQMVVATREGSVAVISKTATVAGTFNSVRGTNAQRATVILVDTEMDLLTARTYRHSWKRLNAGAETVHSYGDFIVEKATQ
jgi:hypothetical protein